MKKILVCIDGSVPYTDACFGYAAWLAKHSTSRLEIVYVSDFRQLEVSLVADFSGSLGAQPYQGLLTQIEEIENEKAKILKNYTEDFFKKEGLSDRVQFHHRVGYLIDMLEDFELDETDPVDLTLLGKRGENADFASEHLGSMMERVVRASCKPCFVASRKFEPIQKICIAYDGGESCQKALHFFAHQDFLKKFDLHIVTVTEEKDGAKAQEYLAEAKKTLEAAGFKPTCHELHGAVEDEVAKFVHDHKINLLCIGAYGHNRIRYLLIGSTTTELIRKCHIPILLFR